MTRKDYELISRVIKGFPAEHIRTYTSRKFSTAFSKANANFDPDKFRTACGL